jgi:hypothetical protein
MKDDWLGFLLAGMMVFALGMLGGWLVRLSGFY